MITSSNYSKVVPFEHPTILPQKNVTPNRTANRIKTKRLIINLINHFIKVFYYLFLTYTGANSRSPHQCIWWSCTEIIWLICLEIQRILLSLISKKIKRYLYSYKLFCSVCTDRIWIRGKLRLLAPQTDSILVEAAFQPQFPCSIPSRKTGYMTAK